MDFFGILFDMKNGKKVPYSKTYFDTLFAAKLAEMQVKTLTGTLPLTFVTNENHLRSWTIYGNNNVGENKFDVAAYNADYRALVIKEFNQKTTSRGIAFGISLIIFYFVIPLSNKHGATYFEQKYKLSHVNRKDGYLVKKSKIMIRPIVYYLIPFIALLVGSKNSIIIIMIGYLFINCLLLIFSKNNMDLAERILKMTTCSIEESLLFESEEQEKEYFNSEEGRKIEDPDYLDRLSNLKKIKLVKSRDEELKG